MEFDARGLGSRYSRRIRTARATTYYLNVEGRQSTNLLLRSSQRDVIQLNWTSNTSRQTINLPTNQKGYDKSETTIEKLSARRIQICWVYFSVIIFDLLFFKTSQNMAPKKYTRQIWILSESNFQLVKDVKLICVRLIISCLRVPAIIYFVFIDFQRNYQKSTIAYYIYARYARPTH